MSRKNFVTFIGIAIAAIAMVFAVLLLTDSQRRYIDISRGKAMREMPAVAITDAEFAVMRAAREDATVLQALQENAGKGETHKILLTDALAEALFSSIVPEGGALGDFAVIGDTVYIDYTRENERIILECLPDYRVRKTFAKYENIQEPTVGEVVIYANNNNERYQKY